MNGKNAAISKSALSRYLMVFFLLLAIVPGEADSMPVYSQTLSRSMEREIPRVQRALESKMVSGKLKELGLAQEDIDKRLKSLTDEELHQFASNIDSLYAGGDAGGVMVVIAVVMMGVMLYYVMTGHRMMGHQH